MHHCYTGAPFARAVDCVVYHRLTRVSIVADAVRATEVPGGSVTHGREHQTSAANLLRTNEYSIDFPPIGS